MGGGWGGRYFHNLNQFSESLKQLKSDYVGRDFSSVSLRASVHDLVPADAEGRCARRLLMSDYF